MMVGSKIWKILLASGAVLLVLWVGLAMFTGMNLGSNSSGRGALDDVNNHVEAEVDPTSPWSNINLTSHAIPAEARARARGLKPGVQETKVEETSILYRMTLPKQNSSPYHIVFLHGAQFDSEIWERLGTMQLMSALGYQCTAIDLPGYGNSTGTFSSNRVNFMKKLFGNLNLGKNIILVSPSMSGSFSLPFLLTNPQHFAGFVPVAPVGTSIVPQNKLRSLKVPTLYLYGANDKDVGIKARDDLKIIPNVRIQSIENAGHAAYLDQPEAFHTLLYNFLLTL